MTNNKTIDKYDVLYASGIEFALRINLCKPHEIEGASDYEIQNFCLDHNVTIPPSLWSYTRHYGKKVRARESEYNCIQTLSNYKYALHQANLREEWHQMMNLKELLLHKNFKVNYDDDYPDDSIGEYTPEINSLLDINNIFVFDYDGFARRFKFLDSSKENPEIFCLTRYYTLSTTFLSLTNRYRHLLFVNILNAAPFAFAEMGIVNGKRVPVSSPPKIDYTDGFECLKAYQKIFSTKKMNRQLLTKQRENFYAINDEIEKKENRILPFTEFENKFIEYLRA